jgi:hypothetical protein
MSQQACYKTVAKDRCSALRTFGITDPVNPGLQAETAMMMTHAQLHSITQRQVSPTLLSVLLTGGTPRPSLLQWWYRHAFRAEAAVQRSLALGSYGACPRPQPAGLPCPGADMPLGKSQAEQQWDLMLGVRQLSFDCCRLNPARPAAGVPALGYE